jgi:hypothetical protein
MTDREALLKTYTDDILNLDLSHRALLARADGLSRRRALVFIAGLIAMAAAFSLGAAYGTAALVVWLIAFGGAVREHRRVTAAARRADALRQLKITQRARMSLDWDLIPPSSAAAPEGHPYALDLDIVGPYSIHRLMDTTSARGGSDRLLAWLLQTPPDPALTGKRRVRVGQMIPQTDFRDTLTLAARLSGSRGKWDGVRLLRWLEDDARHRLPTLVLWLLIGLAALNVVMLALDAFDVLEGGWIVSFLIYGAVTTFAVLRLGETFNSALTIKSELDEFTAVLRVFETHPDVRGAALAPVCAVFADPQSRPSAQLRRLNVVLAASSLRANPIAWLMINLLVPWDVYFGLRLSESKGSLAVSVPRWLDAWYEVEALNALASFAYLNPHYTFGRIGDGLRAVQAGHPLLLHERRVCNDFALTHEHEVGMITGSNMSGKSSFLRTIGVNLVLLYAGSVVCAQDFEAEPYRVFTCIKVSDSVVDGISYFYAEVRRLKALLDALDDPAAAQPVLFLIDEIFKGTNNRERLTGSRAYIRALATRSGCGLISTHDLELTRLAEEIDSVVNYHFREDVRDGVMVFDYRLRPGPCPTTNALKIMALEGLPVEDDGGGVPVT